MPLPVRRNVVHANVLLDSGLLHHFHSPPFLFAARAAPRPLAVILPFSSPSPFGPIHRFLRRVWTREPGTNSTSSALAVMHTINGGGDGTSLVGRGGGGGHGGPAARGLRRVPAWGLALLPAQGRQVLKVALGHGGDVGATEDADLEARRPTGRGQFEASGLEVVEVLVNDLLSVDCVEDARVS